MLRYPLNRFPKGAFLIGTADWTIPRQEAAEFPTEGTHLQRYAARLTAVEINSSFYRSHRASTYTRWAAGVPAGFRFSVKVPKTITHASRLQEVERLLDDFLSGVQLLGSALGCLLVQLPPSLAFDAVVAERFFTMLRDRYTDGVACEPRHASWLQPHAESMLTALRIARVAADPEQPLGAGSPGGWPGLQYYRLHGSPRMYYSSYAQDYLEQVAEQLTRARADGKTVWCIFDNTAQGAATRNALELLSLSFDQGASISE